MRLLRIGPGHDIGHCNVCPQFEARRSDDRLLTIIGFRRHRNDGLAREFRIGVSRPRIRLVARVKRR